MCFVKVYLNGLSFIRVTRYSQSPAVEVECRSEESHARILLLAQGHIRAFMDETPFSIPCQTLWCHFPPLVSRDLESSTALDRVHRKTLHQKRRFWCCHACSSGDLEFIPFNIIFLDEVHEVVQIPLCAHSTKTDTDDASRFPIDHLTVTTTSSSGMIVGLDLISR